MRKEIPIPDQLKTYINRSTLQLQSRRRDANRELKHLLAEGIFEPEVLEYNLPTDHDRGLFAENFVDLFDNLDEINPLLYRRLTLMEMDSMFPESLDLVTGLPEIIFGYSAINPDYGISFNWGGSPMTLLISDEPTRFTLLRQLARRANNLDLPESEYNPDEPRVIYVKNPDTNDSDLNGLETLTHGAAEARVLLEWIVSEIHLRETITLEGNGDPHEYMQARATQEGTPLREDNILIIFEDLVRQIKANGYDTAETVDMLTYLSMGRNYGIHIFASTTPEDLAGVNLRDLGQAITTSQNRTNIELLVGSARDLDPAFSTNLDIISTGMSETLASNTPNQFSDSGGDTYWIPREN